MTGMSRTTGRELSTELLHISQSINDIVTTPVGSRVMRRDYGSVTPDLIDQPLNPKTLLRLYAATAAAIMRWEPRLSIASVTLYLGETDGSAVLDVEGSVGSQQLTTQVQLR